MTVAQFPVLCHGPLPLKDLLRQAAERLRSPAGPPATAWCRAKPQWRPGQVQRLVRPGLLAWHLSSEHLKLMIRFQSLRVNAFQHLPRTFHEAERYTRPDQLLLM